MKSQEDSTSLWFIINKLHEDISKQEEKLGDITSQAASTFTSVTYLTDKVDYLTKVVTVGNGQPALVVQVTGMRRDMDDLRKSSDAILSDLDSIKKANNLVSPKSDTELAKERWIAIGKVAAIIVAVIPGILSFFFQQ